MAVNILQDPNDPENKNGNGPAVGGVPTEAPVAPQSGQAGQAPIAQPVAQNVVQPARARTGSGFQNLQSVLAANKQNRLGQVVGSGIQGIAGQAKQGTQQGLQQFQQASEAGKIGGTADLSARQNLINKISGYKAPSSNSLVEQNAAPVISSNDISSGMGMNERDAGQVPQAFGESTVLPVVEQPLVSQADIDKFATFRAGQYTGPQGIKDYDKLSDQASRAEGLGQLTRSMGGQQELLREFVGNRPDYSRGKRAMDALILGQTGAKDLQQARSSSRGLMGDLQGSQRTAEEVAKMNTALSGQFGKETTEQLGAEGKGGLLGELIGKAGSDTEVGSGLRGDLAAKEASASKEFNDFQARLAGKQLTGDDIQKYIKPLIDTGGLDQSTDLFGLTPETFKSAYDKGQYSLESVADKTQAAKLAALQKLAGNEAIKLDSTKLGQQDAAIKLGAGSKQFEDYAKRQREYEESSRPYEDIIAQATARRDTLNKGFKNFDEQIASINSKYSGRQLTPEDQIARANELQGVIENAKGAQEFASYTGIAPRFDEMLNKIKNRYGEDGSYNQISSGEGGISDIDDIQQSFGDFRRANMEQDWIDKSKTILDALKKDKGAGGSITDLMSEAEKAKFIAANPTQTQRLMSSPKDLLNQEQYQDLLRKSLGFGGAELQGPGKNILMDLAKRGLIGYGTMGFSEAGGVLRGIGGVTDSISSGLQNLFGSDKKLKKNIKPADKKIQKFLDNLKPYSYDYKDKERGEGEHLGIMAQDLEKSDLGKEGIEELPSGKHVNFAKLAGTLIASNGQLNERIKKLEKDRKK